MRQDYKMTITITPDGNKGFYHTSKLEDVEYADPVAHFANEYIDIVATVYSQLLLHKDPSFDLETVTKVALRNATAEWAEEEKRFFSIELPEIFFRLLEAEKKKEQESILRQIEFTPDTLTAFIFKACRAAGFTFSHYCSEHYPTSIDKADLPRLAVLNREEGTIEKTGATTLTDGQIKQAIEQRRVVVAKFLDKGEKWHCFFITYASIRGEESWRNGQPHFHYISDAFGISRADAVSQFKGRKYPSTSIHIPLKDYGNQPE